MRVRRSILNFGTNAFGIAVTMVVALPATRYLQGWLGESLYGGVRVITCGLRVSDPPGTGTGRGDRAAAGQGDGPGR